MENLYDLRIFTFFVVGGVAVELVVQKIYYLLLNKKNNPHFTTLKYVYLLSLPLIGLITLVTRIGVSIIWTYLFFSIIGFILEWCLGYSYEKILGEKLWIYKRFVLPPGYTSLLSIPLWGFCGTFFWLIGRAF